MKKLIIPIIKIVIILTLCCGIFILSYLDKNVWPMTSVAILVILFFIAPSLAKNIELLRIGQGGIELKTITAKAKSTIKELQGLAIVLADNISEVITRMGKWDSYYKIPELYEQREKLNNLLKGVDANDKEIYSIITKIDNEIISGLFQRVGQRYNGTPEVAITTELYKLRGEKKFSQNGAFVIDTDKISRYLESVNKLDDYNKYILSEIKYYQENRKFQNLQKIMDDKTNLE